MPQVLYLSHSVYLNRQHFCGDNTCQKLFPGHISVSCLQTSYSCNAEMQISHYMCTAIIGFTRGRDILYAMYTFVFCKTSRVMYRGVTLSIKI